MASIRIRKNGLYEARLCFKGKYFSLYDRDLNKLKLKIIQKKKELTKKFKNEITLAKVKENLILKNWYKKWLEEDKKPFITIYTLKSIKNVFNNHILPKLGNYKISQINKSIIQKIFK